MEKKSSSKTGELVAGTKLVRFCCDSCFPKFRKNPAAYLSKLPQE